jgi:signal peptidase I
MFNKIFDNLILIIAIIVAVLSIFVFNSTNVDGISMENTLKDQDRLVTDILSKKYERQDIVILFSDNQGQGFIVPNLINTLIQVSQNNRVIYVKRVIGLPGEWVEMRNKDVIIYNDLSPNGSVLTESYAKKDWKCRDKNNFDSNSSLPLDFKKIQVPEDSYFVMGDNRGCSKDSRIIGFINKNSLIGRVVFRFGR